MILVGKHTGLPAVSYKEVPLAGLILTRPLHKLKNQFSIPDMAVQTVVIAVIAAAYFFIRYLNRTDIPKIKGLPEIPGVPLFGNLLQLGEYHATVAAQWAKKYGPVFQVRMGNRVGASRVVGRYIY